MHSYHLSSHQALHGNDFDNRMTSWELFVNFWNFGKYFLALRKFTSSSEDIRMNYV